MKNKLFSTLLVVLFLGMGFTASAQNQLAVKENNSVMSTEKGIVWDSKMIDLGEIQKGQATDATFEFTNKSDSPVVIAKVKSSCGCTVTSYERNAILPGEKASVTATYDAKRQGNFRKTVTVMLSDDSKHMLSLKGQVASETVIVAK
jgi:hypothetical protein